MAVHEPQRALPLTDCSAMIYNSGVPLSWQW